VTLVTPAGQAQVYVPDVTQVFVPDTIEIPAETLVLVVVIPGALP
jgi:hypothetical protein